MRMASSLAFAAALCFKSYFGPLFLAGCASVEVHYFLEYAEFRPVPVLSTLIGWLFEFSPDWLALGYLLAWHWQARCRLTASTFTFR